MKRYLSFLWYLIRHKCLVFIECCKRGLVWRGLVHDLSKFRPSEFIPYARYFYTVTGQPNQLERKYGYIKEARSGDADFDYAAFLHYMRNDHHWQHWCQAGTEDGYGMIHVFPMPARALTEMVCDWIGAGKAQDYPDVKAWYLAHQKDILLHPYTRIQVEQALGIFPNFGQSASGEDSDG
jgi:hypothetical protein